MKKSDQTRNLDLKESMILYGLSAGRCNICNQSIVKHPLLKTIGNMGQRAHVVDHSEKNSARYAEDLEGVDLEKYACRVIKIEDWDTGGLDNIILLCHQCHWNADKNEPMEWPVELLLQFKKEHQERVYNQTEANKKTFLIQYYSMIGDFNPKCSNEKIRRALTSAQRFEEEQASIGDTNRIFSDHQTEFWSLEGTTLSKHYSRRVEEAKEERTYEHYSVFAMASQALLIKLGTLLGNKSDTLVFPCNRDESNTWGWYDVEPHTFSITVGSESNDSAPVIFLRVSGSQSTSDLALIKDLLSVSKIDPYILQLDGDLKPGIHWNLSDNDTFRQKSLDIINAVHEKHGNKSIHVFPALPNHLAVEFGRASLEKVHPPLIIYDANHLSKGWMSAITIERNNQ